MRLFGLTPLFLFIASVSLADVGPRTAISFETFANAFRTSNPHLEFSDDEIRGFLNWISEKPEEVFFVKSIEPRLPLKKIREVGNKGLDRLNTLAAHLGAEWNLNLEGLPDELNFGLKDAGLAAVSVSGTASVSLTENVDVFSFPFTTKYLPAGDDKEIEVKVPGILQGEYDQGGGGKLGFLFSNLKLFNVLYMFCPEEMSLKDFLKKGTFGDGASSIDPGVEIPLFGGIQASFFTTKKNAAATRLRLQLFFAQLAGGMKLKTGLLPKLDYLRSQLSKGLPEIYNDAVEGGGTESFMFLRFYMGVEGLRKFPKTKFRVLEVAPTWRLDEDDGGKAHPLFAAVIDKYNETHYDLQLRGIDDNRKVDKVRLAWSEVDRTYTGQKRGIYQFTRDPKTGDCSLRIISKTTDKELTQISGECDPLLK